MPVRYRRWRVWTRWKDELRGGYTRSPDRLGDADGLVSRRYKAEPTAGSPARCRMRALAATAGIRGHAARPGSLRVGNPAEPCLLSDYIDHFAALRDGERSLGRNRDRRARRHRRHLAVHGRRIDAEPLGRAKRRSGASAQGATDDAGVQPGRSGDAPAAAVHPGTHYPDGADRGMQSAPFTRSATVPLAAAEPGPPAIQPAGDDPGADRQYAGRATRRRDRGSRPIAQGRSDSLPTW